MRALLLTLGHNSSVIALNDGAVEWGYETERLTGVKSDSRFPLTHHDDYFQSTNWSRKFDVAYVTHWDPYANLYGMKAKYWRADYLENLPIRTLSVECSHHDSHAHAAARFAGMPDHTVIFVIDGFGTFGEHLSVYRQEGRQLVLVKRMFGYDTSLGLLYQYATAFMGMKMHEDEYKLLGYEVHIDEVSADQVLIWNWVNEQLEAWSQPRPFYSMFDPVFNLDALVAVREATFRKLQNLLARVGIDDPTSYVGRVVIAYAVQALLEQCVLRVWSEFKPFNLIVTGGVHFNVKLNKILLDSTEGLFCAYPLAGDQGNALGLYAIDHPMWHHPTNLFFGKRSFEGVGVVEGIHWVREDEALQLLIKYLDTVGRVNFVRGAMEFGPRALCHTSTLAKPTRDQVDIINRANNRNTVMPMAPIMTRDQYKRFFKRTEHVHKSEQYMITALEYANSELAELVPGTAHKYTRPYTHYTGRPQVVQQGTIEASLCSIYGPLINTSFNYHGKPIAFDVPAIVENHRLQRARDPSISTIVIVEE